MAPLKAVVRVFVLDKKTEEDQTEEFSSNGVRQRGLNDFLEAVKDSYLNAEVVASHRLPLQEGDYRGV